MMEETVKMKCFLVTSSDEKMPSTT